METSDPDRQKVALGALAIVGLIAAAILVYVFWPVAQLGADEDVLKSVDALFTAVTSQSEDRLSRTEARLRAYEAEGRLPASAARRLEGIIAQARGGAWEQAASALYSFIQGQRREGPATPSKREKR